MTVGTPYCVHLSRTHHLLQTIVWCAWETIRPPTVVIFFYCNRVSGARRRDGLWRMTAGNRRVPSEKPCLGGGGTMGIFPDPLPQQLDR